MKKLAFGLKAKDKITGFEGVLTGRCAYISGCTQWLVAPTAKENDFKSATWFDEQRLEVIESEAIVLDNGATPGSDISAPIK